MKRSEAIQLLNQQRALFPPGQDMSSQAIIGFLMKLGMSPPQYNAVFATGKKYNKDIDQGRDTFLAKGWEPEDD